MKNLIFALPVLMVFLLSACGGPKQPKDVAIAFANAMAKQDYNTAKKYATEDTKKAIDLVKGMAAEEKKQTKPTKYVVVSESISGENATVKLKDTANGNKESEVYLKKVKGKWLVSMDKQQMTNKDNTKKENNENNENNENKEKKELKTQ